MHMVFIFVVQRVSLWEDAGEPGASFSRAPGFGILFGDKIN